MIVYKYLKSEFGALKFFLRPEFGEGLAFIVRNLTLYFYVRMVQDLNS